MSKIVVFHSFRRAAGKSHIATSASTLMAVEGRRVGIVDAAFLTPSLHGIFGLSGTTLEHSLDDFLNGKCAPAQIAHRLTDTLLPTPESRPPGGQLYLIPSGLEPGKSLTQLLSDYDPELLAAGFRRLIEELELDALIVDTDSGFNSSALLSTALCEVLVLVMRLDKQDLEGTPILLGVAQNLEVPSVLMVVNEVPGKTDLASVDRQVSQSYNCDVGAVIPHTEELVTLSSREVFVLRYPEHPITEKFKQLSTLITARLGV